MKLHLGVRRITSIVMTGVLSLFAVMLGIRETQAQNKHLAVHNQINITTRHCQKYGIAGLKEGTPAFDAAARRCAADDSTVFYNHTNHNERTNAGGDWQASVMGNTAAPPATCNYIGLSNDATAPAPADTVLASEITLNGLARAQGAYAHTTGTASYTMQRVFSATGTQPSQKSGAFNAASSGTMCFEGTYTQVTVNSGDYAV